MAVPHVNSQIQKGTSMSHINGSAKLRKQYFHRMYPVRSIQTDEVVLPQT